MKNTVLNIAERLEQVKIALKDSNDDINVLVEDILDSACEFRIFAGQNVYDFIDNIRFHLEDRGESLRESNEGGDEASERWLRVYESEHSEDEIDDLLYSLEEKIPSFLEYAFLIAAREDGMTILAPEFVERLQDVISAPDRWQTAMDSLYESLEAGEDAPCLSR